MSYDEDYKYALELQKRLNAGDDDDLNSSNNDVECIDFKKPSLGKAFINKTPSLIKRSNPRSNLDEDYLNRTQNLVHPQWETLDPTPDINALFQQFDTKFFQDRLKCVTLEWSKKMYSCAGICYSRKNRYGMDVTIRLSEPLLKLRSRKDLVETMLHEMIHAYCFVLNIREGNGGHGAQFKKIMYAINKVAGTNITVYHTFHDEVNLYKQHWWRCNGVCQDRSPFFGYVKRTSNRAPGPNDIWWAKHQHECGGTFMKIKEPEKAKKPKTNKSSKEISLQKNTNLRNFFVPQTKTKLTNASGYNNSNQSSNYKGVGGKVNGGGTLLLNPRTKTLNNSATSAITSSISKAFPPSSYPGLSTSPGKNIPNIVSLKDITTGDAATKRNNSNRDIIWGKGKSLITSSDTASVNSADTITKTDSVEAIQVDRQHLREIWSKRFEQNANNNGADRDGHLDTTKQKLADKDDLIDEIVAKRPRVSRDLSSSSNVILVSEEKTKSQINNETKPMEKSNQQVDWLVVDDDVMLKDQINGDIISLSSSDSDDDDDSEINCGRIKSLIHKDMTIDERQNLIKKEILDETLDLSDSDIELIDDEYDDKLVSNTSNDDNNDLNITAAIELADTSIIDEFFGEDTLLKEFHEENDLIASSSRYQSNPNNDIITCPICQSKMARSVFSEHLNGCTGIAIKIEAPKHALQKLAASNAVKELRPSKRATSSLSKRPSLKVTKDILKNAGYNDNDLDHIVTLYSTDETDDDDNNRSEDSRHDERSSVSLGPSDTSCNNSDVDEDANISSRRYRQRSLYKTTRQCPLCAAEMIETDLADHIKTCRKKLRK